MYWALGTSIVVTMHDDIENTSVGTDHVITVIYQSIALQTGARLAMMLHTCIGAGHRNGSELILIMEWPNITSFAIFQYHLTVIAAMTCPYMHCSITLDLPLFLMRVVNTVIPTNSL